MTNTMTPSEIAEVLGRYSIRTFSQAAATIRELEDDRDQEIRTREATVELLAETEAKLKIATEALEKIGYTPAGESGMPLSMCVFASRQALARIKEVG